MPHNDNRMRDAVRRLRTDPDVYRLTAQVAGSYRVPIGAVLGRSKTCDAVTARQVSIYLAHTLLSRPHEYLAGMFGRHHSTVSHACHRIEDQRDEPRFDARLAVMEQGWAAEGSQ